MSLVFNRDGMDFDTGICERNLNLLAHAQMIEFSLGSQCGGHGKCGKDRVRIPLEDLRFFSPVTAIERAHLSEQEIGSGVRLACQCFPDQDGVTVRVFALSP